MALFGTGVGVFLLVTVALGGGAAWMTGRAVAVTWKSTGALVFYVFLLTLAIRFIHFALFDGALLSIVGFLRDLLVTLGIAFLALKVTRGMQMKTQYGFIDAG